MTKLKQNSRLLASSACAALLLSPLVQSAGAQDARARAEVLAKEWGGPIRINDPFFGAIGETNRAVIGVSTSSGGKDRSDTLGVLVESVTAGSPAEKAGIKQGNRLTAVNGVNLRISSLDSEDPELQGLGQRRLIRELGKAKVGDEVEIRVSSGSSVQTLRLKTVSPADLVPQRSVYSTSPRMGGTGVEKHASIGAAIGSTGSVRDTLGIFVSSVAKDGPAEKAGIVEGDRIAAINGVDVRVSREDAEDFQVSAARANRFSRELAKLSPGDKATLRVYSDGKYREVQVTTGSGNDIMLRGFQFNTGDGIHMLSLPRMEMNMPAIIRKGSGADSNRIIYRKAVPSEKGTAIRKVSPVTIRKASQE